MRTHSWHPWVQQLEGLFPTQALVLEELARLADQRGVAIVSTTHLVAATGRSRAGVFRALSALEERGVLQRERRRSSDGRRRGLNRYRLIEPGHTSPQTSEDVSVLADLQPASTDQGRDIIDTQDDDALRSHISQALARGWEGTSATVLARTIRAVVPLQFSAAVKRAQDLGAMSREEAILDTTTRAWEALIGNADAIVTARRPWALWTTIVSRVAYELHDEQLQATDPSLIPETGQRPGEGESQQTFGIDDFDQRITGLVQALTACGMEETIAWAGTARMVEVAMVGPTRRHTAAAIDPRLADLGIGGSCARLWMTLLAGSRSGAKASILTLSGEDLLQRAHEVVTLWQEEKTAA